MNQHRFGVNAAYLGAKAARTPDERPGPAGWSGALLLDEFYRANGNPGLVTPTKAQAAWDDTFLYVLFLNWESARTKCVETSTSLWCLPALWAIGTSRYFRSDAMEKRMGFWKVA